MFLRKKVIFLGHVVTTEGISSNPEKTQAVEEWPTLQNLEEIRSFLELASYYHRFVLKFSSIVVQLTQIREKGVGV